MFHGFKKMMLYARKFYYYIDPILLFNTIQRTLRGEDIPRNHSYSFIQLYLLSFNCLPGFVLDVEETSA